MSRRGSTLAVVAILVAAAYAGLQLVREAQHATHHQTTPAAVTRHHHRHHHVSTRPPHGSTSEGPVTVSGVVEVSPLPGWRVRRVFLSHDPPFVRLVKGNVRLNVLVADFGGNSAQLAASYASQFVLPFASASLGAPVREWVRMPSGAVALRLVYQGSFVPGKDLVHELTVVKQGTHGVVFDGWATPPLFRAEVTDLRRMVAGARIG